MYVIKDSILFIIIYRSCSLRIGIDILPDKSAIVILPSIVVKVE